MGPGSACLPVSWPGDPSLCLLPLDTFPKQGGLKKLGAGGPRLRPFLGMQLPPGGAMGAEVWPSGTWT